MLLLLFFFSWFTSPCTATKQSPGRLSADWLLLWAAVDRGREKKGRNQSFENFMSTLCSSNSQTAALHFLAQARRLIFIASVIYVYQRTAAFKRDKWAMGGGTYDNVYNQGGKLECFPLVSKKKTKGNTALLLIHNMHWRCDWDLAVSEGAELKWGTRIVQGQPPEGI